MTFRIYKYPLQLADRQIVKMRDYSQILTIQEQNGWPYIWAMVNDDEPEVEREFLMFGTGEDLKLMVDDTATKFQFIGTIQVNGVLVFHFFEKLN